jgi:hypothetical protein
MRTLKSLYQMSVDKVENSERHLIVKLLPNFEIWKIFPGKCKGRMTD